MNEKYVKVSKFVEKSAKSCNCLVDFDVLPEYNGIFVRVFRWDEFAEFNEDREEGDYIKESTELFENIKNNFGDIVEDVELAVPNRCSLLCYGGFEHREINITIGE
ncbi:MAG: hypothetical protein IJH63_03025 [Methanobrevibacter sp.]|nr:hypothetical protein [Methanobrevibacter sp.]